MLDIHSAATAYAMLGSQNVWDAARRCHEVLSAAGLQHAVVAWPSVCTDTGGTRMWWN
jgi:hypothetical protein